ncbi:MAG: tetratricopeptide repeat protein [Acidobacteriota bacterium]|nr:tetratricopeptide repeat protein [Acidobacteriota bacterium]
MAELNETEKAPHAHLFAEQPDLARFIETLKRVKGFALYFAHCNLPTYRAKLTEAIRANLSRPLVVVDTSPLAEMDQQTRPAIDGFVENKLEGVSEEAVVFIVGLENLLPSRDEERTLRTAAELNWRRGFFQRMRRPMVFWLPEYALTVLARNAPDLYDWYSGVYDLEVPQRMRAAASSETLKTIQDTEDQRWMSKDERDRWEDVLQDLLAKAEANSDPNNLSQAEAVEQSDLLDRLGQLYLQKAEYEKAKDYRTRALKISEAAFDPNHPNVARDLNNLALVLKDLGELQNARDLLERSLKISEAAFGTNHPKVATSLNNLAGVLQDLGELQNARDIFERSLKIDEAAFGPNHPNVATSLNNLASVLKDLGELQNARDLLERSLKISEAAFGTNHPNVATSLNNLASVLKDLGELQNARELCERSLGILRQFLGENHPNTKTVKANLDAVLKELGETSSEQPART